MKKPVRRLCFAAILLNGSAILAAQTITEYPVPVPASSPNGITSGPDGALWFAEGGANRIGRITTAGVFTEFPLPPWPSPYSLSCQPPVNGANPCTKGPVAITTGPDGALWFTEAVGAGNNIAMGAIGRITLDGTITEYPVSSPAYSIVTGPDGALWFGEFSGGFSETAVIGRITTGGAVTEYSPPPGSSSLGPFGITSGPDGALWFTEPERGGIIGRTTTAFVTTEYPLPSTGTPVNITSGPDGALWFTDQQGGAIWRITTAGDFTKYPLQNGPYAITTGPDGALWFTESGENNIGRITTDGAITEYPVPASAYSIVTGPDGALWFTENGANKIARLTIANTSQIVTVVNGASFAPGAVVPGSIATVFAEFPSTPPTPGRGLPLPTELQGLKFAFAASASGKIILAPIFFVSANQANIQIPWELTGQTQLTVFLGDLARPQQPVKLTPFAPGIFSADGTGVGQGAIVDSKGKLVDASNPAMPGDIIQIYCTGLGAVRNPPPDGSAAPSNPPARTLTMPTVRIGSGFAPVQFSGLAPGFVGLYQLNIQVPNGITGGNTIPVTISIGGVASNAVTIAIALD